MNGPKTRSTGSSTPEVESSAMAQRIAIWNSDRLAWESPTGAIDLFSTLSDLFLATWPSSGMTRSGSAFELPMPALPMDAIGSSSLLMTPKASDGMMGTPSTSGRPVEKSTFLSTQAMLLAGHLEHRRLLPTPTTQDAANTGGGIPVRAEQPSVEHVRADVAWGVYEPAIRRWEAVLGRPAPALTNPDGKNEQERLAAEFVEWMQGCDEGWVTDPSIGLTRNQMLKALGNGVVKQQAALALGILNERRLSRIERAA